jgi:CBS domain containing-hemolysin-like protein
MEWGLTIFWWLLVLIGTAGMAVASGIEMGSYALSRVRLNVRGDWRARILRAELHQPDRLLAALLIASNIFSYIGALGLTSILARAGLSDFEIVLANTVILTPALFVFAESLPKEIFRVEADRLTYAFAIPFLLFRLLLTITGILPAATWIGRMVAKAIGSEGAGEGGLVGTARERVAAMVKEGAARGVLSESQATLVDRALALRDTRIADEMVPWPQVRAVIIDWDRRRLLAFLARERHARFPVLDRHGHIAGVLDRIDVYLSPDAPISSLLTPAVALPPEMSVREALGRVYQVGAMMAVVERGGRLLGILTTKDLLEPLTGELVEA